ncbi:MAG TPA: hypothetical protein VG756_31510 [Pseudonocardiaceae bacterium]|jgi:hypothetical protein|nr:hypothetical protein [Pseudonocardiaceae bacterium]
MTTRDGGHLGALAEFAALRTEIERRSNIQQNLFALQLTISGAVFSFALSSQDRVDLLLIIPISTYILAGRYVIQHYGIVYAGEYIKEVLSQRIPDGLDWEKWLIEHRRKHLLFLEWADPHYMTYPGISVLALAWVGPHLILDHGVITFIRVGTAIVWLLGVAATVASFYLVWYARRGWWQIHRRWLPKSAEGAPNAGPS